MDKLLETVASQVPSLIVLAVIVRWFLTYMTTRDKFIAELHEDHLKAREESREALLSATVIMQEVRDTMRTCRLKSE